MELNELHEKLYYILCDIDDICKKEKITYSLFGGTMLGAVRHQGFIPWDDDVDIIVLDSEWPIMKRALEENLPEHLHVITPADLSPHFFDFVYRVYDDRYHWHSPTDEDLFFENKQNHICVDIFVVSDASYNIWRLKKMEIRRMVLYGLAMGHRYLLDAENYSVLQRFFVFVLSTIGRKIPMDFILKLWDAPMGKKSKKRGEYCIIHNMIPSYWKLRYKKEWFEKKIQRQFETRMLPLPCQYDAILTAQYGDYMSPPADKSRFISHMKL